ncbi:AI-2E family transporter [Planctomycetes bacterium TBK1r]|uniref:AI-2E family transporter n=1 Tax=Stieleria magnilauensis TaxID=2527963 RepID=UPI0011A15DC7
MIGNQAKLHPLVALVTVLGALKLMGLWGIFVGPMVAAFFYALLNITRDRVANQRQLAA